MISGNGHDIPDMQTGEGLHDIIALGNLCLFLSALETRITNDSKACSALHEARRVYFDIIYQLQGKYTLILLNLSEKQPIHTYKELFHHPLVSLDIADFAKSSALHFACSLILSARKAAGWRQLDIEHFENAVKSCLDFYFSTDVTDTLLNASVDRQLHFTHQILVWPKCRPLSKWFCFASFPYFILVHADDSVDVDKWVGNVFRERELECMLYESMSMSA